jgi:alanyl-tRNA synthetase
MSPNQIRQQFLDFFASKGHAVVPSAPIVVKNDPTLMFTNAGMNQFKDIFLGNQKANNSRVANTQKCLRVSGKHNDLEEVGVDTYHHTMFEMLGNWSFGDYFKKEAIVWAWELLTEVYQLPKDRLYVTVFEGDSSENLAFDQESFETWANWIDKERILNGNKKDNFWEMGDTGPCGPCSEIHIDLRTGAEIEQTDGKVLVNTGHPQVIEIWNLVFMEFNRKADGSLEKLPNQHVDTGMGFERLCRAIEGKASNYDTDLFVPFIRFVENECGLHYGEKEEIDVAMRVLADHIRTICFAIVDGQMPSNTGAGYVIRRILRRAVRYYYTFLGIKTPLLFKMVSVCADSFLTIFPELKDNEKFVANAIKEEELTFLKTLENGIKKIENLTTISSEQAFELYDTFGFPIDLTQLIAKEKGIEVDLAGFEQRLAEQKERSRKASNMETGDWFYLDDDANAETAFVGYDTIACEVKVLRFRKVKNKGKDQFQLVFDKTPFYAEGGGQIGDKGYLENQNEKILILDTQKENNLIIHLANKLPESASNRFEAKVDTDRRKLITANHSATHLLHAALRQTIGKHVEQKGSLVSDEYLRFDFSHFKALAKEELAEIERIVNEKIRENIHLDEKRNIPIDAAKQLGAMALFGEKYGDSVRVITFDASYSIELCGGTHVNATGNIGQFMIVSEAAVAAGIRRIEAISGVAAENYIAEQRQQIELLQDLFKTKKITAAVDNLLAEKQLLLKKIEQFENEQTNQIKASLKQKIKNHEGIQVLVETVQLNSADQLKNLTFQLRNETDSLFCVLGAIIQEKPNLSVVLSDNVIASLKLNASNIVKQLAKHIQGGGGGQAFYANAGGNDASGITAALLEAETILEQAKSNRN